MSDDRIDDMEILPSFQNEADALARIIALSYQPERKLTDAPDPDVVRLLGEALQCAYEAGGQDLLKGQAARSAYE